MGKKKKVAPLSANQKYEYTMKVVTSKSCITCKRQCARGLAYIEKMNKPGAVGKGVPCILTKGKAYQ
ncbi:hypothetical protein BKP45_13510 [Anaerobacillus alkalidiazotrophicus]|uniref:Uncharacterized protein n=1 Tax=Anaerobacillus alkalidiazotrophicus TaxID=472963 RepID=A0A1S2M4C3_9BACI|nr:hypothetical protein [Anaerobacillus alkalidiazotrophicus]OIJ19456.1 hypothetical protein BKP45_13510 [Anaerobacillus alkalidiazotrophicus]